MYQGSTAGVPNYFAQRGHACPHHYNPADWIMNRAQVVPFDELDQAGFFPSDERKLPDPVPLNTSRQWSRHAHDLGITMEEKPVGKTKQIQMLLRREVTNFARDRMALAGRIGFSTLLSVLIGAIFMGVGASDSSNIAVRIRFVVALCSCSFTGFSHSLSASSSEPAKPFRCPYPYLVSSSLLLL